MLRSYAEAEYKAMASVCYELTWIKCLLSDMEVKHEYETKLVCDNKATMHIVANPIFHKRTKHVELNCYLVRKKIQEGSIVTKHIGNRNQLTDIFTKVLSSWLLKEHMVKMGAKNIYSPS